MKLAQEGECLEYQTSQISEMFGNTDRSIMFDKASSYPVPYE